MSDAIPLQEKIKDVLKNALKKRKMTYGQLASSLGVSVPTVKRVLNDDELTLSRFLEICDVLKLSPKDVFELSSVPALPKRTFFTERQEDFLHRNPGHLGYLARLWKGETPGGIARALGLERTSTQRYLADLEMLDLIRVRPGHRVDFLTPMQPHFRQGGLLVRSHLEDELLGAARYFFEWACRPVPPGVHENFVENPFKVSRTCIRVGHMTRATHAEYMRRFRELFVQYGEAMAFEDRTLSDGEKEFAGVWILGDMGHDIEKVVVNPKWEPRDLSVSQSNKVRSGESERLHPRPRKSS